MGSIVALRGQTRDTILYLHVFDSIKEFPIDPVEFQLLYNMEVGFGLISALVKFAGLPVEFLFFIISALTFFYIVKASIAFGLNAWSAIPFYLPTFFLTQQFMQIRQGLAVALAFWAIALVIQTQRRWTAVGTISLAGSLFHVVSLAPIIVAQLLSRLLPRHRSYKNWIWLLSIFAATVLFCKGVSSIEIFELTNRINVYVGDEEYGSARSIFDPANLRAIFLTLVFIKFRPREDKSWFRTYMFLIGLYVVHLGIRIGFIDFAILSGRLASSIGFSEIFLLALIFQYSIKQLFIRLFFIVCYMVLHFSIALLIQLPYLIDDYFVPL